MSDSVSHPVPTASEVIGMLPLTRATAGKTVRALVALTKPRLGFFSVLTAMAAYSACHPHAGALHGATTLLGTALAAGGALSLNQWLERGIDGRMRRTRMRPLPQAQIAPALALAWSVALSLGGTGLLAWRINLAAAACAAATIVLYGFAYTPLKRRTRWATEVGSLSGALPPLIGSAAAGDILAPAGWMLASVLLCWQMPHFFAVGWMYRDDYRAAGFPLLPAVDATGARTAIWSLLWTLVLLPVSIAPWLLGWAGPLYGITALIAGLGFAWRAAQFVRADGGRDFAARRLFFASILYLPLVMAALLLDRFL